MKSEELMVGDCVMPLKKLKGIPGKVVTIDGGTDICWIDSKYYSCLIRCSDIEGIPLTPEILEKNGFRHEANKNYVCYAGKAKIAVQFRDKVAIQVSNEFKGKDNNGRADLVSFLRDWTDVLYVHYLQHVIRLCGIEKEIVL